MRRLGVDVEGIGSRLGENMLSKEDLVDQIVWMAYVRSILRVYSEHDRSKYDVGWIFSSIGEDGKMVMIT